MLLGCRDCTSLGMTSGMIFHISFLCFILILIGCRDRTPLGMNSGYIATSQLSSSGTYNRLPNYHINYARLAIKLAEWRIQDINGGWIQVTSLHRDKFHHNKSKFLALTIKVNLFALYFLSIWVYAGLFYLILFVL